MAVDLTIILKTITTFLYNRLPALFNKKSNQQLGSIHGQYQFAIKLASLVGLYYNTNRKLLLR